MMDRDVDVLNETIDALTAQVSDMKDEIAELRQQSYEMKMVVDKLQSQMHNLIYRVEECEYHHVRFR